MGFFKKILWKEDGGKKTLNQKNVTLLVGLIFSIGLCISLTSRIIATFNEDTSTIKKVDGSFLTDNKLSNNSKDKKDANEKNYGGVVSNNAKNGNKKASRAKGNHQRRTRKPIVYRANQVLTRNGQNTSRNIPIGTNIIGKLITSIDTRNTNLIKVILPYGAKHKQSGAKLPRNTIVLGRPSYPGHGEKVFIIFTQGILPSGREIKFKGHALNTKDYSAGLEGVFHGNTGNRIASVLGLSMIGGMTEVLVEKESLGQSFDATPKATIKNGVFNGISNVANMEANIQAKELANKPEYVTVEAGTDLIVSLTGSYQGKQTD